MFNLTKEQRVEAFECIRDILLGKTFGSSKNTNLDAYDSNIFIDYEEFKHVQFIGYGSDDVDAFLNVILNNDYSCPPIRKVILFKFPQFHMETNLGNNVYVLAQDDAELCYMVGGMTDYSGSGGASYKQFQLVIQFLIELYDIRYEVRTKERGTDNYLCDIISKETRQNVKKSKK